MVERWKRVGRERRERLQWYKKPRNETEREIKREKKKEKDRDRVR